MDFPAANLWHKDAFDTSSATILQQQQAKPWLG